MSLQWTENAVYAVRMKLLMISLFLKIFSNNVAIITVICIKICKLDNNQIIIF